MGQKEQLPKLGLSERIQFNLFLAHSEREHTAGQSVRTIFNRKQRKSQRAREIYNITARTLQSFGVDIRQTFYDRNYDATGIPFHTDNQKPPLIAHGTVNAVFYLETEMPEGQKHPPHVLKMDSKSLVMDDTQRIEYARRLQEQHATVQEQFADVEGFVVPTTFIIGEMPYKRRRAVGIIQPYIKNFKGVFEDYTNEQLENLLATEPDLRGNFTRAVSGIHRLIDEQGMTIDLLGSRNLSIQKRDDGSHQLVLLESELFDIDEKSGVVKNFTRRFSNCLNRLDQLRQFAERFDDQTS